MSNGAVLVVEDEHPRPADVESALEESFNGKVCHCIEVVEAYG